MEPDVPVVDLNESMDEAVMFAEKFLEDILAFFGLNAQVHASADEEVIQLSVPSSQLNGFLIGQRGDNMRSLQHLVSAALKNGQFAHSRVNVDIADYKKQRNDRLREKAEVWIKQVRDSNEEMALEPMNAAERRIVHQLAADYELASDSAGEGRDRHVVLKPSAAAAEPTETDA